MKDVSYLVLISTLLILAIILGPLAVIFALNTLFPVLAIPYGIWQWLAVVILNLTWMYKPNSFKK